jgi:hypothetical protein
MAVMPQKPNEAIKRLSSHLAIGETSPKILEILMVPICRAYRDLIAQQACKDLVRSTRAANEVGTISPVTILNHPPFVTHLRMLGEKRSSEAFECAVKSSHDWQRPNGPRISCGDL